MTHAAGKTFTKTCGYLVTPLWMSDVGLESLERPCCLQETLTQMPTDFIQMFKLQPHLSALRVQLNFPGWLWQTCVMQGSEHVIRCTSRKRESLPLAYWYSKKTPIPVQAIRCPRIPWWPDTKTDVSSLFIPVYSAQCSTCRWLQGDRTAYSVILGHRSLYFLYFIVSCISSYRTLYFHVISCFRLLTRSSSIIR